MLCDDDSRSRPPQLAQQPAQRRNQLTFLVAKLKEEQEMKRSIFLAFVLSLIGSLPLLAQDVRYNFDSKADFTQFKTYKRVDIKGADHANQLAEKQIQDAVDAELAKKAMVRLGVVVGTEEA
jgi:hypothetical protein